MTVNEFSDRNGISREQVGKWIKAGLIPEANIETDYIPDSARVPYTEARAKRAKSIYNSIIKATELRKHVMPALYKMTNREFDNYIGVLEREGFIQLRTEDEVTYYDATLKTCEYNYKLIATLVNAAGRGITEGVIEKVS